MGTRRTHSRTSFYIYQALWESGEARGRISRYMQGEQEPFFWKAWRPSNKLNPFPFLIAIFPSSLFTSDTMLNKSVIIKALIVAYICFCVFDLVSFVLQTQQRGVRSPHLNPTPVFPHPSFQFRRCRLKRPKWSTVRVSKEVVEGKQNGKESKHIPESSPLDLSRQLDKRKKKVADLRLVIQKRNEQVSFLKETVATLKAQFRECKTAQMHYSREIARLRRQLEVEESDFDWEQFSFFFFFLSLLSLLLLLLLSVRSPSPFFNKTYSSAALVPPDPALCCRCWSYDPRRAYRLLKDSVPEELMLKTMEPAKA